MNGDPRGVAPDEGDEVDAPGEGDAPPGPEAPAPRGRKKRLKIAKADELAGWDHMAAEGQAGIEFVLTGDGIGPTRADASKVGAAIERLARLLHSLDGGSPLISSFSFGNSVHITLEPSGSETTRARKELERAKDLRDKGAPADDVQAALRASVSDVEIAAGLAADLMSATVEETPLRAAELGSNVATAMRSLSVALAKQQVSVSLTSRGRMEPVRLSAARAARVAELLGTVQEARQFDVVATGVLAMADALNRHFALTLDAGIERPPAFKGKRIVRGGYQRAIGDVIRDDGWWGKRVTATIRVRRDAVISTSKVRPPTFTLVNVASPPD